MLLGEYVLAAEMVSPAGQLRKVGELSLAPHLGHSKGGAPKAYPIQPPPLGLVCSGTHGAVPSKSVDRQMWYCKRGSAPPMGLWLQADLQLRL